MQLHRRESLIKKDAMFCFHFVKLLVLAFQNKSGKLIKFEQYTAAQIQRLNGLIEVKRNKKQNICLYAKKIQKKR